MREEEMLQSPETGAFEVKGFFDPATYTVTYVVYDPTSKDAVILDPVLDYEPAASQTDTRSLDEVAVWAKERGLRIHALMETHAHADHLSGSQILKERYFPEAQIVIGEKIRVVQKMFKHVFGLPTHFRTDGSQFDRLLGDGEVFEAGTLRFRVLDTPGHTPACVSYLIGDAVFTGDTLFMHDYGTGRCDFPGGDARALYRSVHERLYKLPESTRVFVGHDYQPKGRGVLFESTIGQQKRENPQLSEATSEEDFVRMREGRDATLAAPKLLFQSVQVNIDAGHLPKPEENEIRYLRIPVNVFRGAEQKGVADPDAIELTIQSPHPTT